MFSVNDGGDQEPGVPKGSYRAINLSFDHGS